MGAKCHRGVDDAEFQTGESSREPVEKLPSRVGPSAGSIFSHQLEENEGFSSRSVSGHSSWPSTAGYNARKRAAARQDTFSSPPSTARLSARSSPRSIEPVVLHIYNVGTWQTQALNRFLRPLGTGIFHCGVEVYGVEWSYSDTTTGLGDGIFDSKPMHCEGHTYYDSVSMGMTNAADTDVLDLICMLQKDWPVDAYDTLTRNCCHFSNELCQRLGVGSIPIWVMSLAGLGASVAAAGDTTCCRQVAFQAGTLCCASDALGGGTDSVEIVDVIEQLPVLQPASARQDQRQQQNLHLKPNPAGRERTLQIMGRELTH